MWVSGSLVHKYPAVFRKSVPLTKFHGLTRDMLSAALDVSRRNSQGGTRTAMTEDEMNERRLKAMPRSSIRSYGSPLWSIACWKSRRLTPKRPDRVQDKVGMPNV